MHINYECDIISALSHIVYLTMITGCHCVVIDTYAKLWKLTYYYYTIDILYLYSLQQNFFLRSTTREVVKLLLRNTTCNELSLTVTKIVLQKKKHLST